MPNILIKTLGHVCVKTTDLDEAERFYCRALGMRKIFNFTKKGKIIGFYMKAANDTFVEVFLADAVGATGQPSLDHFALLTESIEKVRATLIEHGYSPSPIEIGADNGLQCWVSYPAGMGVEIQQFTETSSQFTGKDVEATWLKD